MYKIVMFLLLQYYMDSRTSPTHDDIHMSIDIRSGRLSRANFDLGLMQRTKLDRTKGEEID